MAVSKYRLTSDPDHPDFLETEELLDLLIELLIDEGNIPVNTISAIQQKIRDNKGKPRE